MATIAPCIWIPDRAEEAAAFYLGAFQRAGQPAELRGRMRRGAEGALIAVTVVLAGQEIMLFNPSHEVAHSHAFSLFLTGATQAEAEALRDALLDGGTPAPGGWLTDRYGISWQVVPAPVGNPRQPADAARA